MKIAQFKSKIGYSNTYSVGKLKRILTVHSMKAYEVAEAQLPSFFTSAVGYGLVVNFTPRSHYTLYPLDVMCSHNSALHRPR
jgi:hypothetical protein